MARRRFIALFASNLLSLPLNLVISALLLRYLGVAAFGQIAWISAILLLLGNIVLETMQSFTLAGPRRTDLIRQISSKLHMVLGLAGVIILQSGWIIWGAALYPFANIVVVSVVLIATMGVIGVIWAELRNRDDYLVPNLINRLLQAVVLVLGCVLLHVWALLTVASTLGLYALASTVTLFTLVVYLPPAANAERWVPTRRVFSYFKDNAITMSAPQIALILPGFFVAAEVLAVLRVALQMANLSLLLPTSLYYIYVPRLVQSYKSRLPDYHTAMRFVRLWGTVSLLFAIVAAIILHRVVEFVFPGVDMTLTYQVFLVVSLGNLLATALGPTNHVLSLTGQVEFNFRLTLVTVGCLIVGGGFVMAVGLNILYFIGLTAVTTIVVKVVAFRALNTALGV